MNARFRRKWCVPAQRGEGQVSGRFPLFPNHDWTGKLPPNPNSTETRPERLIEISGKAVRRAL